MNDKESKRRVINIGNNEFKAVKKYCDDNSLKMGAWAGKTLLEAIKPEYFTVCRDGEAIRYIGSGLTKLESLKTNRPATVDEVIAANPGPVGDYLRGKESGLSFLVGQVEKLTGGRYGRDSIAGLLRKKLDGQPKTK